MIRALTIRQREVLSFLTDFRIHHGYTPTVRAIGDGLGMSSTSTVQSHLVALEKKGFLRREHGKRGVVVLFIGEKLCPLCNGRGWIRDKKNLPAGSTPSGGVHRTPRPHVESGHAGRTNYTPMKSSVERWGIVWYSRNRLDGVTRHILWDAGHQLVFFTRNEARQFIKNKYGYIAHRVDLRAEPHGWRMPQATKVTVTIENKSD